MGKLALASVLITAAYGSSNQSAHTDNFEWAGVFETPLDQYTWTAQKTGTEAGTGLAYVDATMTFAAIPVAAATDANLHAAKSKGNHALSLPCSDVRSGDMMYAREGRCYKLIFDQKAWQSLYTVRTDGTAAVAFFTQHFPTEFENDAHYLKDFDGEDIEPVAELPVEAPAAPVAPAEKKDTPWGATIGASLIVNAITLVGVILAIPALSKMVEENKIAAEAVFSGFGAGAILACAFFLLLFEATHLVATGWDEEVDVLWRWGTMILAGMMLPAIVHSATGFIPDSESSTPASTGENQALEAKTNRAEKARIFLGVNLGDFFHNLCDGIFLGAAFKGCGSKFGWSVLTGTVLHEIPQELVDYTLLVGPQVNLSPLAALACNFASGLGVVLGAIIVLASDVDDRHTGLLLAFGGGVYIHIAAVECMPRMYAQGLSRGMRIVSILAFIIGTVLIGLVLLDHEHCVPPAPPGAPPKKSGHHH